MVPQKSCTDEVQIIPSLVPHEKCVDVPKEVCTTARVNPRKVMKPVIKRWCGPIDQDSTNEPDPVDCSHVCQEFISTGAREAVVSHCTA